MDRIIELGEMGIKQDIPQELIDLTSKNNKLKVENKKLETAIWIVGISLAVVVGYYLWDKFVTNKEINKEDEYTYLK